MLSVECNQRIQKANIKIIRNKKIIRYIFYFKKFKYNEKFSVIFKIKITKLKISKNSRIYIY